MRISELSSATDVPVGTIKYYLREGLLPPGERTSRTTARYDRRHLERLRLVRALMDPGGLGIEQIRRVVAVIDADDPPRLDVLATAQDALLGGAGPADGSDRAAEACDGAAQEGAGPTDACARPHDAQEPCAQEHPGPTESLGPARARHWAERRGWFTYVGDRVIDRLERAWAACEDAGIDVDDSLMDRYADAVEEVARLDVASVPPEAGDAVRRVVVGTVMLEPVLASLRLLAQRQVALTGPGAEPRTGSDGGT